MDPAAKLGVGHPSQSEEALWRLSLGGDGEAFGLLFDRHRERVYRHARRLTESRQDAEDVAAATFLELWRRQTRVRLVEGSVLPWLLATATNMARNTARNTRRYRRLLERLPRAAPPPDTAEVAFVAALGVSTELRVALRRLGETDAQLFALVALEDYGVADAAQLLELTAPAARARLHRVRATLRERLNDDRARYTALNAGGDA